uniref:Uncharacterized protein n=1 Tax=viral metagenome TaxID=1070528 RepID=A0A6C0KD70_9ZZZZ
MEGCGEHRSLANLREVDKAWRKAHVLAVMEKGLSLNPDQDGAVSVERRKLMQSLMECRAEDIRNLGYNCGVEVTARGRGLCCCGGRPARPAAPILSVTAASVPAMAAVL